MASQSDRMKQTVAKDRSPPESDFMSLDPSPELAAFGVTYKHGKLSGAIFFFFFLFFSKRNPGTRNREYLQIGKMDNWEYSKDLFRRGTRKR